MLKNLLSRLKEHVTLPPAVGVIEHRRGGVLLSREVVRNVITNSGRDFLHSQGYGTSGGMQSNGLNFIGLSNDALTETAASTSLSNEITALGLSRSQGTVSHTPGTNVTTVSHVFTCGVVSQSVQKAALFTAGTGGVMCHALAFTQRTLALLDTLTVTFTVTLG